MIMMMITFSMSILIMLFKHPLTMGLTLLIQTIIVSLTTGFLNMNYWYSYILFLIMIGGMLVLFIYMTSVASNEKFYPSIKIFFMLNFIILLTLLTYLFIDSYLIILNNIYETKLNKIDYWSLNKYLNFPNNFIMYLLIIYLFITLLATVKVTDIKKGPLRNLN